jgi:hypothetical protein
MKDFTMKLMQPNEGYAWIRPKNASTYAWNGIVCNDALRQYVTLPKSCHNITLVFSEKRKADSFKLIPNDYKDERCNPFYVSGTGRRALYHGADQLIRRQLKLGRQWVRVEYT